MIKSRKTLLTKVTFGKSTKRLPGVILIGDSEWQTYQATEPPGGNYRYMAMSGKH